jgi:chromate transporter
MIYRTLFLEFFKAGLFAVGGGLATLPFLREMAAKYPWFSVQELTDMIAISESTPGPIGVNMATFAGYRAAGILGGITATLSLVLPSLVIIIIISSFMERFQESLVVQRGFYAIRAATAGLIAGAMFEVFLLSLFNLSVWEKTHQFLDLFQWKPILVFASFLFLIRRFPKIHPAVFILAGAVLGVVLQF